MYEKLIHWFIFSVLIATIPIGFNFIIRITTGTPVTLISLWGRGELLIIAVGIGGRGIGELLRSDTHRRTLRLLLGGISLILLIIASLWFGLISAEIPVQENVVSVGSILIYFFVVISGGLYIILMED
jgi:hypothetical protein